MAKGTAAAISYLIDSASEDEFARSSADVMPTPESNAENTAPRRKAATSRAQRVPSSAIKATKAKGNTAATVKKEKDALAPAKGAAGVKKATAGRRKVLAERNGNGSDTEEVDDLDGEQEEEGPKKAAPARQPTKTKRGRPAKSKTQDDSMAAVEEEEEEQVEEVVKKSRAAPKTARAAKPKAGKRAASVEPASRVIPETQPEQMDVEQSMDVEDEEAEPAPRPVVRHTSRARSGSRQRHTGVPYRRAGSVSDPERSSDPALRRKLGDMTKKFEALDAKYQNLREVGMRDAETNFDKLRRSTEQRAKDQDDIIASLKKELANQRALASESRGLQSRLDALKESNAALTAETKTLKGSLQEAKNDTKSLTAKLASIRNTPAPPSEPKVPGSAVKATPASRAVLSGNADAQIKQLKEELYSDLTGLIIRGVKRLDGEDEYDCIQTGRNGTLHFHLSVPAPSAGISYEEAEIGYMPLLDENRDRDLMNMLPDYLLEEIFFPRSSASKFYARVGECMNKKIEVEAEEEE